MPSSVDNIHASNLPHVGLIDICYPLKVYMCLGAYFSGSVFYFFLKIIINFPLSPVFAAFHKCVVLLFSCSSKYFKISLEIYSWTHVLFINMLFDLQICGDGSSP